MKDLQLKIEEAIQASKYSAINHGQDRLTIIPNELASKCADVARSEMESLLFWYVLKSREDRAFNDKSIGNIVAEYLESLSKGKGE